MTDRPALIIANGELPDLERWSDLLQQNPLLVAADGGAERLTAHGLTPHVVIGDLDSFSSVDALCLSGARIIRITDQETTDLEKALDYLLKWGCSRVTVLAATGLRSDHTLANFSILLKYHRRMDIRFRDAFSEISVVERECTLVIATGTTVSLIPMEPCIGVTTTGLRWNLRQATLAPGVRESISNRVISSPAVIRIDRGRSLLFVGLAH
ncbi:MAG TPA: thiamine diphosphokinase [bacterium]|nr:thiamine diphosphokinase [bacterium]HPN36556.1 thiamine diphosphokinase [bacterium]